MLARPLGRWRTRLTAVALCGVASTLQAQGPVAVAQVDNLGMQFVAVGLGGRAPGQSVVILESGAGDAGTESWAPLLTPISEIAPVLAYDRRGIGGSDPDSERPSLRRAARSLRALLDELQIAPPYVLVSHSWGGLFATAFYDQYAADVSGLVFLEATDFESTWQEKAAAVPLSDRQQMLRPPAVPPIPPDPSPGLLAEFALVRSELVGNYPEGRSLRRDFDVPTAVVVATPPGRLEGSGALVRLQISKQAEWALRAPDGIFMTAGHVGHAVHRDDPDLVVRLIRHVVEQGTGAPTEQ